MWKQIRRALRERKEVAISIPLPDGRAEIGTMKGGPPWEADMLIRVQTWRKGVYTTQYFETTDEAKRYI